MKVAAVGPVLFSTPAAQRPIGALAMIGARYSTVPEAYLSVRIYIADANRVALAAAPFARAVIMEATPVFCPIARLERLTPRNKAEVATAF